MEEDEISSTDTEQLAEMGHVYSASSDTHLQTHLPSGIYLFTLTKQIDKSLPLDNYCNDSYDLPGNMLFSPN